MDLTTLTMFLMLIASAIGADTVLHPTSVVLDAAVAGKLDKLTVDAETLSGMLTYEVTQICSTPSVLTVPEIRAGNNKGVGMAIAEAVRMQSVAIALQAQLGYQPEQIKLTLLGEDGVIKMLVSGSGLGGRIRTPPFQEQLTLQQGESLAALVHRAALLGMTRIDPYITALYLLEIHTADGDFSQAEALINDTKAQLPQTPVSFDRSVLENLQGIMALFRGKLDEADSWFHAATTSDPDDAAAALNAAFVDVQLGHYRKAAQHVEELLANQPKFDKTLLATAYMTWGAALLSLNEIDAADQKLAKAVQIDPSSSAAYELWSDVKRVRGDGAAADQLHGKAWAAADTFENYAEVAALYFRLAWKPGQALTRSPFINPGMIRFN
jgi:Tfp pilus assembly protein PilF